MPQGLWLRLQCLGFRIYNDGFRVEGVTFRFERFRVYDFQLRVDVFRVMIQRIRFSDHDQALPMDVARCLFYDATLFEDLVHLLWDSGTECGENLLRHDFSIKPDFPHRVTTLGCIVWISRFRFQGSGSSIQGPGFRVHDSGSRVQGPGFRVHGSWIMAQSSGFRVYG